MATVQVTITPADFAKYMERLGAGFYPAAIRGIRSGAMRAIPVLQRRTQDAPPASANGSVGAFNTGMYKASWRTSNIDNGVSVSNIQPYAAVIEGGRRPSPVSREGIKNLQVWAQRKLGLSAEEAKSAAFAIAKTLQKKPLRARNVMGGGVEEISDLIFEEIDHEIERALESVR